MSSFWREISTELRRHAGDERLPIDVRGRLRTAAHRAHDRAEGARIREVVPFPRHMLRVQVPFRMPEAAEQAARRAIADAGLDLERPFVALEVRSRVDLFSAAIDYLATQGFRVVRVGTANAGPVRHPAVLDLAGSPALDTMEPLVLARARFVVCEGLELQRASYTTNTPSLMLNARDPFSGYPVRAQSVFTLAAAMDLDTGRVLDLSELLTEPYFRNLRNIGHVHNSASEILAAVVEMHEGMRDGIHETERQSQFRAQALDAGMHLAARVPHVAKWGPVDGFLGEGRLARFQAERT